MSAVSSLSDAVEPAARGASGVVAVLTAAGSGTRLGSALPKALVPIAGRSIVSWAAQGLLDSGLVDVVVVTAPQDYLERFRAELGAVDVTDAVAPQDAGGTAGGAVSVDSRQRLESAGRSGRVRVVAGSSASRQASVALGIDAALALCPQADVILVHDAARPFTPAAVVGRVVEAVRAGHGAVIPAVPVTDTIKQVGQAVGATEQVERTVDRAALRAVQTPQGFRTEVLVAAHRRGAGRAAGEHLAASDDAGLVEAGGGAVSVVAGDPLAFKITRPLDLALAQVVAAELHSR